MVRIIPEADISMVLAVEECVTVIEDLHRRLADGEAMSTMMETILTPVSDPPEGTTPPVYHGLRTMNGSIYGEDVATVRISSDIIHWPDEGSGRVRKKLPVTDGQYNGFVILFGTNTGEPLAIFPDAIVQHLRVGATSALAAKSMANEDASRLGVLGAGWQARSHVPALDHVLDLDTIEIYSPTPDSRETFAAEMKTAVDADVTAVAEPREVFRDADVVQCVTNATTPIFEMDWVEEGTHVTIIRLAEAPRELFDLSVVDGFATNWPPNLVQHEMYGNRLQRREINAWVWNNYAIETDEPVPKLEWFEEVEAVLDWDTIPTLAEILAGDAPGRTGHDDVTGFFTCAVGVDFTAVGNRLYEVAEAGDLGRSLPLDLFSQDHHP